MKFLINVVNKLSLPDFQAPPPTRMMLANHNMYYSALRALAGHFHSFLRNLELCNLGFVTYMYYDWFILQIYRCSKANDNEITTKSANGTIKKFCINGETKKIRIYMTELTWQKKLITKSESTWNCEQTKVYGNNTWYGVNTVLIKPLHYGVMFIIIEITHWVPSMRVYVQSDFLSPAAFETSASYSLCKYQFGCSMIGYIWRFVMRVEKLTKLHY